MYNPTMVNLAILVGLIPLGILVAFSILRGIDKLNGVKFTRDIMPKIMEDSVATSIYFGIRFASVCAFAAYLCGRFV